MRKKSLKRRSGKENRKPSSKPKPPKRPQKLRLWSNESMLGAMKAVQDGRMGVNRAALEFQVPRTTLKDRISGREQILALSLILPLRRSKN